MSTRTIAMLAALAAIAGAPGLRAADTPDGTKPAAAAKPNIVFIMADDVGYGDIGCYGATKVKTPHIDRFAAEGIRFTDAHAASAVCSPSRYALLTGEYAFRRDLWGPLPYTSPLVIDTHRATLASIVKSQGYATACLGKWHLGFGSGHPDWNGALKPGPLELGFDYYFGVPVVSCSPPFVYVENHRVVGLDPADPLVFGAASKGKKYAEPFPEKFTQAPVGGAKAAHDLYRDEQFGTTFAGKAVDWIRQHRGGPFFLYLATPQIHHPFTPQARFKGSSQCGRYGDFLQEFDWMVGEVLRTLDELKLADDTLVIVTSDNGGMLNQGGQDAWRAGHRMNGDLLGFKFDSWEGGHRVPFLARWPGHIKPGAVSQQLICHVDMPATIAALTGYQLRPGDAPDSINVLEAFVGEPAKPLRDHVVLAPHKKANLAIRQGQWVYIGAQGGGGFAGTKPGEHALGGPAALKFAGEKNSDVEDGRLKPDAPKAQLYDLQSDPSQAVNIIRQHPDVAERLRGLLEETVDNPSQRRSAPGMSPRKPNGAR